MKGPKFNAAMNAIGRRRLAPGLVAILDNAESLRTAIRELYAYGSGNKVPERPRRGIVFRIVEEWECQAIRHKLIDFFGPRHVAANEGLFSVPVGHLHFFDDSFVSHACNRHAIVEGPHNHLLLTVDDFEKIPEVVDPRHIREFSITKGMPRIVYERVYGVTALVVVQEIQSKAGLAVKTAYKKK
jgi:hypothetical protein